MATAPGRDPVARLQRWEGLYRYFRGREAAGALIAEPGWRARAGLGWPSPGPLGLTPTPSRVSTKIM